MFFLDLSNQYQWTDGAKSLLRIFNNIVELGKSTSLFGEVGWAQIDYVKDIIYSAGTGS